MGSRLALMVGLPRSGKSTYAKALQENGWTRISYPPFLTVPLAMPLT